MTMQSNPTPRPSRERLGAMREAYSVLDPLEDVPTLFAEIDARGEDVRALLTRLELRSRSVHSRTHSSDQGNQWSRCKIYECREDNLLLLGLRAHYDDAVSDRWESGDSEGDEDV